MYQSNFELTETARREERKKVASEFQEEISKWILFTVGYEMVIIILLILFVQKYAYMLNEIEFGYLVFLPGILIAGMPAIAYPLALILYKHNKRELF